MRITSICNVGALGFSFQLRFISFLVFSSRLLYFVHNSLLSLFSINFYIFSLLIFFTFSSYYYYYRYYYYCYYHWFFFYTKHIICLSLGIDRNLISFSYAISSFTFHFTLWSFGKPHTISGEFTFYMFNIIKSCLLATIRCILYFLFSRTVPGLYWYYYLYGRAECFTRL